MVYTNPFDADAYVSGLSPGLLFGSIVGCAWPRVVAASYTYMYMQKHTSKQMEATQSNHQFSKKRGEPP